MAAQILAEGAYVMCCDLLLRDDAPRDRLRKVICFTGNLDPEVSWQWPEFDIPVVDAVPNFDLDPALWEVGGLASGQAHATYDELLTIEHPYDIGATYYGFVVVDYIADNLFCLWWDKFPTPVTVDEGESWSFTLAFQFGGCS